MSISSFRSGSADWALQGSNLLEVSTGWASVVLTKTSGSEGYGQTENGPIVYLTVVPANSSVDINDCSTFRFAGIESDMADQDFYGIYPSAPCAGRYEPINDNPGPPDAGRGPSGRETLDETETTTTCAPDIDAAKRTLMVAGGLVRGTEADMALLDRNGDGRITLVDAVSVMKKLICAPEPTGWSMLQGNAQHTGIPEQPLSPSITMKWDMNAAVSSDRKYMTKDYFPTDNYRYLEPSVVAVPDPSTSTTTDVYAAVGFMPQIPPPGQSLRPYTRVYRVADTGTTHPSSSVDIDAFYATGTPLVVGDTLVLTGVTNVPEQAGDQYPAGGCVIALNAANLTERWRRNLPGSTYSSPVYYAGQTQYTDQTGVVRTHIGGCVILAFDNTYIAPYDVEYARFEEGVASYLCALSLEDGKHVWGTTVRQRQANPQHPEWVDGDLAPDVVPPTNGAGDSPGGISEPTWGGLVPFEFNSTYSSPIVLGSGADVQDHSCYVNARNLLDGSFRWEQFVDMEHEESSISVFDGKMHWGAMTISSPLMPGAGGVSCMAESLETGVPSPDPQWTTCPDPQTHTPNYPEDIGGVWGGVVVHPTERIAVFGSLDGFVRGADADGDPFYQQTTPRWADSYDIDSPTFSSPILALDPATSRYHAFFGADDGKVHVLQAQETVVGSDRQVAVLSDNGQSLHGPIRSSMASLNGRLYVLSAGDLDVDGVFTSLPRLCCFAP